MYSFVLWIDKRHSLLSVLWFFCACSILWCCDSSRYVHYRLHQGCIKSWAASKLASCEDGLNYRIQSHFKPCTKRASSFVLFALTRISIIPRSFIHCRAKWAAKFMYMNPTLNAKQLLPPVILSSTAQPKEPNKLLNIWTQHLMCVQLIPCSFIHRRAKRAKQPAKYMNSTLNAHTNFSTAEPNEPACLMNG